MEWSLLPPAGSISCSVQEGTWSFLNVEQAGEAGKGLLKTLNSQRPFLVPSFLSFPAVLLCHRPCVCPCVLAARAPHGCRAALAAWLCPPAPNSAHPAGSRALNPVCTWPLWTSLPESRNSCVVRREVALKVMKVMLSDPNTCGDNCCEFCFLPAFGLFRSL